MGSWSWSGLLHTATSLGKRLLGSLGEGTAWASPNSVEDEEEELLQPLMKRQRRTVESDSPSASPEALNEEGPLIIGAHQEQGCRPYQEDRATCQEAGSFGEERIYAAVYDGHAGSRTCTYLEHHLLSAVQVGIEVQGLSPHEAMRKAFADVNADLRHAAVDDGSTATVVYIDGHELYAANAGDSPCFIIMQSGEVVAATEDHSPNTNMAEHSRVRAAGGRIERMTWGDRGQRVLSSDSYSGLAMTRAFGDFKFPGVIADPHVSKHDISGARFAIIASDGLTEAWSIQGAADYLMAEAAQGHDVDVLAQRLVNRALMQGSRDNVTALILNLETYLGSRAQHRQQKACVASSAAAEQEVKVTPVKGVAPSTAGKEDEEAAADVDVSARDQGMGDFSTCNSSAALPSAFSSEAAEVDMDAQYSEDARVPAAAAAAAPASAASQWPHPKLHAPAPAAGGGRPLLSLSPRAPLGHAALLLAAAEVEAAVSS